MNRLRIAWARHKRNREHWAELEEVLLDNACRDYEIQRLRNEVARKDREIAELEAELRAYQGVA
jgi:hypothetical protein